MNPQQKSQYNADYYRRHRKLKGRETGTDQGAGDNLPPKGGAKPPPKKSTDQKQAAVARVNRLKSKVKTLTAALSEAESALSASRQASRKKEKESSDGKSTAQEKQSSQTYRDKHQTELKAKAKKESSSSSSSSGGSSSSTSSSKSVSDMSAEELGTRITKIRSALQDAKRQLATATAELGQLAHSAIVSDPNVNLHFALFRSERIPSK